MNELRFNGKLLGGHSHIDRILIRRHGIIEIYGNKHSVLSFSKENRLNIRVCGNIHTLRTGSCATVYGNIEDCDVGYNLYVQGNIKGTPCIHNIITDRLLSIGDYTKEDEKDTEQRLEIMGSIGELIVEKEESNNISIIIQGDVKAIRVSESLFCKGKVLGGAVGHCIYKSE